MSMTLQDEQGKKPRIKIMVCYEIEFTGQSILQASQAMENFEQEAVGEGVIKYRRVSLQGPDTIGFIRVDEEGQRTY